MRGESGAAERPLMGSEVQATDWKAEGRDKEQFPDDIIGSKLA